MGLCLKQGSENVVLVVLLWIRAKDITVVFLFVCVFTFEVSFKHLFAPTSQNRMSKIFRDLESLGNSNGKKWSHIGKLLLINGVKLSGKREKKMANLVLINHQFDIGVYGMMLK